MNIGVSTACLYPMNTEEALLALAEQGIKNVEIFINCDIEINEPISTEISKIIRNYKLNVLSVHPTTWLESFYLFSNYERRKLRLFDIYKRHFERMNEWGAKIAVMHGSNKISNRSDELYLERYVELLHIAECYGVILAQENVVYCKSGDLDFLCKMKRELGERAAFTLDLKQALRSGLNAFDILERLDKNVVHVHASDNGEQGDCLPVGSGNFDFAKLFACLIKLNYTGGIIVELYRENFKELSDLSKSTNKLVDMLNNM